MVERGRPDQPVVQGRFGDDETLVGVDVTYDFVAGTTRGHIISVWVVGAAIAVSFGLGLYSLAHKTLGLVAAVGINTALGIVVGIALPLVVEAVRRRCHRHNKRVRQTRADGASLHEIARLQLGMVLLGVTPPTLNPDEATNADLIIWGEQADQAIRHYHAKRVASHQSLGQGLARPAAEGEDSGP